MKQLTVKLAILAFLQANDGEHHGGQLQRMNFYTRNNGLATGDNIKRRLNELVEEGLAFVSYKDGQAYFSANPAAKPKTQTVTMIEVEGRMVAKLSYV